MINIDPLTFSSLSLSYIVLILLTIFFAYKYYLCVKNA